MLVVKCIACRQVLLTIESVPTSTDVGPTPAVTISEMKLEVMPMTAIMDAACAARQRTNVAPKAPWLPNIFKLGIKEGR